MLFINRQNTQHNKNYKTIPFSAKHQPLRQLRIAFSRYYRPPGFSLIHSRFFSPQILHSSFANDTSLLLLFLDLCFSPHTTSIQFLISMFVSRTRIHQVSRFILFLHLYSIRPRFLTQQHSLFLIKRGRVRPTSLLRSRNRCESFLQNKKNLPQDVLKETSSYRVKYEPRLGAC